jgi:hypothetical protein
MMVKLKKTSKRFRKAPAIDECPLMQKRLLEEENGLQVE